MQNDRVSTGDFQITQRTSEHWLLGNAPRSTRGSML